MQHLASSIKQVQANHLSFTPSLKPTENLRFFLWFRGGRSRSQIIPSNAPNAIHTFTYYIFIYTIRLFTYFTATVSRIPLFDSTLEFFERIKIFTFVWNFISQKTSFEAQCLGACQVALTNNYLEGCTYFSLSQKNSTILMGLFNVLICKFQLGQP